MRHSHIALAMILLSAAATFAADPDIPTGAPDQAQVRSAVDALLKRFTDHKTPASLGMLQQAMDLSISFGAPAWNDGDHEACCNFYSKTAQSICAAFPDQGSATPLGWAAIADLKSALAKIKTSTDIDRNAWIIRYAFDKAAVNLAAEITRSAAMMELGTECLNRGEFDQAEDAFTIAAAITQEMNGLPRDHMNANCLLAPMALTDALFGNHKYNDAAKTIQLAITTLPELPKLNRDMHRIFGNPVLFQQTLDDLAAQADKSPTDVNLQLLLGYEYYFSGRRSSAKKQFEKTLALDKDNPAAKSFLDHIQAAEPPQPGDPVRRSL